VTAGKIVLHEDVTYPMKLAGRVDAFALVGVAHQAHTLPLLE
jgi:hypothetical protein